MTSAVGQSFASLDTSASQGLLHDCQLDYYGKRVAAASGDHTVHVWDVTDGQQKPAGQLRGHEGPVWKVSWAHPKFGSLIATCGYDMKVIIWKEVPAYSTNWQIAYMDTSHNASVNDVQFCPWEHGLRVACASSDGMVSVLTYGLDHQWRRTAFMAHAGGAQSLSWMPVQQRQGESGPALRLATGGCDGAVCVWKCTEEAWTQESPPLPPVHSDWVRAVAWRPEGQSASVIASGAWDKTVVIWAQEMEGQPWRMMCKLNIAGKVEGLSWSVTGSVLAVSFGDGEAVLYREAYNGSYEEVGKVAESGFTEVAPKVTSPNAIGMGSPPPVADLSSFEQAPAPAMDQMQQQQQAVMDSFGF